MSNPATSTVTSVSLQGAVTRHDGPEARRDATGSDDADGTDTDEETVATSFRIHDARLWSMDGTTQAYGSLKIRGVFDGDQYLNPRGHDDWEIWRREDGEAITVEEGVPEAIDIEAVVDFPEHAMTDIEENERGPSTSFVATSCSDGRGRPTSSSAGKPHECTWNRTSISGTGLANSFSRKPTITSG